MIIKLLEDTTIDGKLRVKGEICNVFTAPENSVIIKDNKQLKAKVKKVKHGKAK